MKTGRGLRVSIFLAWTLAGGASAAGDAIGATEELAARIQAAAGEPKTVRAGKRLYGQLCSSCHGDERVQGAAPTNLFDAQWLHGERPQDLWKSINQGILEKGMPAWQGVLAEDDVVALTAYLWSRQPKG